jgi:hypothetical protein
MTAKILACLSFGNQILASNQSGSESPLLLAGCNYELLGLISSLLTLTTSSRRRGIRLRLRAVNEVDGQCMQRHLALMIYDYIHVGSINQVSWFVKL